MQLASLYEDLPKIPASTNPPSLLAGAALLSEAWAPGTFPSSEASLRYHYAAHGGPWASPGEYTQAAEAFWVDNNSAAIPWSLKDGTYGYKITTPDFYGIFTTSGKIISFGRR